MDIKETLDGNGMVWVYLRTCGEFYTLKEWAYNNVHTRIDLGSIGKSHSLFCFIEQEDGLFLYDVREFNPKGYKVEHIYPISLFQFAERYNIHQLRQREVAYRYISEIEVGEIIRDMEMVMDNKGNISAKDVVLRLKSYLGDVFI